MFWLRLSALLIALGIGLGAFGAHALKEAFNDYQIDIWEKAVFYHISQSVGLLVLAVLNRFIESGRELNKIMFILASGIIIFSFSLYLLAFSGLKWLGAITPVGGVLMIIAWLMLVFAQLKSDKHPLPK